MNRLQQRIRNWGAVISICLATSATGVVAENRYDEKQSHAERRMALITEKLDLTEQQVQQIKAIHQSTKAEMQALKAAIKETRQVLQKAVKSDVSTATIDNLAAKQGKLMGDMLALKAHNQRRVLDVLTDEQHIKAERMHIEMAGRMRHRGDGSMHHKGKRDAKGKTSASQQHQAEVEASQ